MSILHTPLESKSKVTVFSRLVEPHLAVRPLVSKQIYQLFTLHQQNICNSQLEI